MQSRSREWIAEIGLTEISFILQWLSTGETHYNPCTDLLDWPSCLPLYTGAGAYKLMGLRIIGGSTTVIMKRKQAQSRK